MAKTFKEIREETKATKQQIRRQKVGVCARSNHESFLHSHLTLIGFGPTER
ncbi:hypothetical protein [Sporosarcina sp. SAFN-010]|uniref:hypothetical protein n=1 Tax=Sporosarcina sp. SAFN-010 TaxID=3387273 RepID=UPI003F7E0FFF